MRAVLIWVLDSWGSVDFSPVGAISGFMQPLCQGGWEWRGQRADGGGLGLKVGEGWFPDHRAAPKSMMGDLRPGPVL